MKSVLIGTVAFSRDCLEHLIRIGAPAAAVVTRASSTFHADFADLSAPASAAGIPVVHATDVNDASVVARIASFAPDVVFCFGWSQILSPAVLAVAPLGVVGYHPALLPRNRGRHPLIWALALGLEETGSTFFFMDEGADSGDILSQRRIGIGPDDDAGALYGKMTMTALEQISDFVPRLAAGTFERRPQDGARASYWRKRSAEDGRIDFRMPTTGIHNLVRALARPYPGASVRRGDGDQAVWRTIRRDPAAAPADAEPGRVLAVRDRTVEVRTGDGVIGLVEHELEPLPRTGDYL
jgi:methionyl-tRNA formyltransferase